MLELILGRAGSGKTAGVMRAMGGLFENGRGSIMIVPEQYSHDAERQLCAECGVEYLLYCPEQPGSETQLACFERVYQNESCTIYRVQPDTET